MPDIYFDVDVALSEVPVNIMPLLDDTDFKTRETAVAYNAAGMDIVWNFVTSAGNFTQTAVTPTTGGNYDWTHQGDAMYTIEIPASGGASINNDTEGYGWFTGFVTGVLPWRGPIIGFRAAAINDSLCDAGTTGLLSPTVAARTLDVTATGAAGIDWANVENPTTAVNLSATNIDVDQVVASVSGNVGGNVTGSVGTVNALAANVITAAATAADFTTEIQAGLATSAALTTVDTVVDAIKVVTDKIDTALVLDGAVYQYTANALELGPSGGLDAAGVRAAVGLASANLDTQLGDLPTATENADALLDRNMATGTDSGGRTVRNALRPNRNKVDASTGTVYKEDDTTTAWTFTTTTDAAAQPITVIDPA